jgi:protoporphyrinogen oxidase
MRRRDFIQISSLSLAALLVDGCETPQDFDIEFKNDMPAGHLVFESHQFPIKKTVKTDYLIVGGGIAGISAAYQLKDKDFLLFEVSDMLGGTSAGSRHGNIPLCHGAHYDLDYPANYGPEVLQMLEELNIIKFDSFSDSWKFVDRQYLIPKNRESQTFAHGIVRKDVLPEGPQKTLFANLMKEFIGEMMMPTRLIPDRHRYLNNISLLDWLRQKLELSSDFIEGLDYHMKDDYGAGTEKVSALAGIHYFACRPYYTKPVELFSPPEGNSYFVNKIVAQLPKEKILTSHIVKRVAEKDEGFEVQVIDGKNREILMVNCEKVIYAGDKHALKYVYPNDFRSFEKNEYAPWVVVNFVMKSQAGDAYWQNEIISQDKSLMGFVDSRAQFSQDTSRVVFTVYYCFKPEEREMMSLIETRKEAFVAGTAKHLEDYFDRPLRKDIEKVFIKQMGHAMPIPQPGYLFNDANKSRGNSNLAYAGVDNGRLPLLFEAIDSGTIAVKEVDLG